MISSESAFNLSMKHNNYDKLRDKVFQNIKFSAESGEFSTRVWVDQYYNTDINKVIKLLGSKGYEVTTIKNKRNIDRIEVCWRKT